MNTKWSDDFGVVAARPLDCETLNGWFLEIWFEEHNDVHSICLTSIRTYIGIYVRTYVDTYMRECLRESVFWFLCDLTYTAVLNHFIIKHHNSSLHTPSLKVIWEQQRQQNIFKVYTGWNHKSYPICYIHGIRYQHCYRIRYYECIIKANVGAKKDTFGFTRKCDTQVYCRCWCRHARWESYHRSNHQATNVRATLSDTPKIWLRCL